MRRKKLFEAGFIRNSLPVLSQVQAAKKGGGPPGSPTLTWTPSIVVTNTNKTLAFSMSRRAVALADTIQIQILVFTANSIRSTYFGGPISVAVMSLRLFCSFF